MNVVFPIVSVPGAHPMTVQTHVAVMEIGETNKIIRIRLEIGKPTEMIETTSKIR